MRYAGFALLGVLLASSAAHATVYVWKDREGALILTNDPSEPPDAASGPLITYTSSGDSSATPAGPGGAEAAAPAPAQPGTVGPAGNVAAVAPGGTATARAAAANAPRSLGDANARYLIAAAANPTDRPRVDPRALLDAAASAAPPQVIVSIVEPTGSRLSTSDGATSLGRGSRAPSPGGLSGGMTSGMAGGMSGGMSGGMR